MSEQQSLMPTFECTDTGTQYVFTCPKCGKRNSHGPGYGHRISHCQENCWPDGYFLKPRGKKQTGGEA